MILQEDARSVTVAEDDDDDFMFFSIACEELPYKVMLSRATNGDELLAVVERHNPDILFLDILMPCKGGRECLKQIRSDSRYDSMPIIMYTSMTDLQNIEFCFREGANLYMIKPVSVDGLRDMLHRILSINWKKMIYFPTRADFVIE